MVKNQFITDGKDYSKYLMKEYEHWYLLLHEKQYPYIGRSYAWAKRDDAFTVDDITEKEATEVMTIILPEWNKAIKKLYQKDRTNFSIMCNETTHLHAHFIPRYFTPRIVHNFKFVDHDPNGNYAPYAKPSLPEEFLLKIRDEIINELR